MDSNKKWKEFAKQNSIPKTIVDTPIDKVNRQIGLRCRPFIFWNLVAIFVFSSFYFSLILGVMMFFPQLVLERVFDLEGFCYSLAGGAAFGLYVATHVHFVRRRSKIPPWSSFSKN